MEKILSIQKKIGVLIKTENNPFYKSKYLDINALLEQLQPLLAEEGLTVLQPLAVTVDSKNSLSTQVFDGDKQIIASAIILPDLQDPQKMGSAITYYRRYALQSLFLLRAEDDDGNIAKPVAQPITGGVVHKPIIKTLEINPNDDLDFLNK